MHAIEYSSQFNLQKADLPLEEYVDVKSSQETGQEEPVAVFWCAEQESFTVEKVEDWVGNKMSCLSLVKEVHLYLVQVFEDKESAHRFVEKMSNKELVLHRNH